MKIKKPLNVVAIQIEEDWWVVNCRELCCSGSASTFEEAMEDFLYIFNCFKRNYDKIKVKDCDKNTLKIKELFSYLGKEKKI